MEPETILEAGATVGKNFEFRGRRLHLGPGARIGDNVRIDCDTFTLGHGAVVEHDCQFSAIRAAAQRVAIGDFSTISFGCRFLLPELRVGDYTIFHPHVLVNGYQACTMGHNGFVGQYAILNASERLTIGNNCRVGINAHVWTHVESGELLEGCNFYGRTPTTLEDDVWMCGGNATISPGVTLARGTIILPNTVVTRSTQPRRLYSGIPAQDLTDKLKPYREVSLDEKYALMAGFVQEFLQQYPEYSEQVHLGERWSPEALPAGRPLVLLAKHGPPLVCEDPLVSTFSLEDKTYRKRRTQLEERFIRFHVGCRARFIPLD